MQNDENKQIEHTSPEHHPLIQQIIKYRKLLIALVVFVALLPVIVTVVSYQIIEPHKKYVLDTSDSQQIKDRDIKVGLVLGAGVTKDNKPYRELQARLDVAAAALKAGEVDKLLLSGDNRFVGYNEPEAMFDYLHDVKGVPASQMQADYAGRSTYESCERASKIFGLKKTIIFSAGSHLPRAIYLCRSFGIESYGISSNVEFQGSERREVLARVKAIYNMHLRGEQTVLGDPIKL